MTNIDILKGYLITYVNEITEKSKGNMYICPLCKSGTGTHKTGAFNIIPNSNGTAWKCHSCGRGGTIIDLYSMINNIDTKEAIKQLLKKYSSSNISTSGTSKLPPEKPKKKVKDYTNFFQIAERNINQTNYLNEVRKISRETISFFHCGYIPKFSYYDDNIQKYTSAIIIPTSNSSYMWRSTDPKGEKRKQGKTHLLNTNALYQYQGNIEYYNSYCVIVEGELDCLSIFDIDKNVIGLGSANMVDNLIKLYCEIFKGKQQQHCPTLIFALDNDKTGKEWTNKALFECSRYNIACIGADVQHLYGGHKDANEMIVKVSSSELKKNLEKEILKVINLKYNYLPNDIIKEFQEQPQSNHPKSNNVVAHRNGNENYSTLEANFGTAQELPNWIYLSERGKKRIDEKEYCYYITNKLQIKTIKGKILTIDKELEESELENIVFNEISEHINQDIALKTKKLVSAIKIYSFSQPLKADKKRIHLLNGTYHIDTKTFENNKYWCINRLNISYNPNASSPIKWIKYLNELLNNDDIITLQEFLGYCLIPTCKAQIMLFLIGAGGEGKSVIADIIRALIGDNNINDDKIHELQNNRFKVANCENKLLNIDDDLNFKALEDTGLIKSVITGANISVEQKGKQAYKIKPYCRLLAFGNGTLNSLYDHTTGFYRRQVIINTKPKPKDRIDNPFLADEIIDNELEGVFLWCLEGLNRLLKNNFKIFISQASKKAIEDLRSEAFNFIDYLQDSDEVQFNENYDETSVDIYASYCNWCYNNALKPLKNRTVLTYLKEHSGEYGIQSSEHIIKSGKRSRGFKGIRVSKYNQSVIL